MARDLIGALSLQFLEYENKPLPKSSSIFDLKPEKVTDFVSLIDLNYQEYKKNHLNKKTTSKLCR